MTGSTAKTSLVLALFAVCQFALACACTPVVIWCPHESNLSDHDRTALSEQNLQQKIEQTLEKLMEISQITVISTEELCIEYLRNNKVSLSLPLGCLSASKKDAYQGSQKGTQEKITEEETEKSFCL